MIRSPAEISTIMPSVESSTRIAYSKMRRDGSARNSADRISVAAEPISARIFRNRAKSSTMKLPLNVVSLPAGSHSSSAPIDHQQANRKAGDEAGRLLAPIGPEHQQHHGADGQHKLRQHGQQLITCTLKAHGSCLHCSSAAAFTAVTAVA